MIKAMLRNKAVLFDKYAVWVLAAHKQSGVFGGATATEKNIHHQFFGFVLNGMLSKPN